MIYYGIEQTTDLQNRETRTVRFTSVSKAHKWVQEGPKGYAWEGAADESLPPSQQNWHRRLRSVYEMPSGFRLTVRAVDKEYDSRRRWHREPWVDVRASLIMKAGVKV